jgi:hypothetical protein
VFRAVACYNLVYSFMSRTTVGWSWRYLSRDLSSFEGSGRVGLICGCFVGWGRLKRTSWGWLEHSGVVGNWIDIDMCILGEVKETGGGCTGIMEFSRWSEVNDYVTDRDSRPHMATVQRPALSHIWLTHKRST